MKTLFNTLRQFATLFVAVVLFLTIIPSTCNAQTPPHDKQLASAINTQQGQESLLHEANRLVEQEKWIEAVNIMRLLVQAAPDDARYHVCLGANLAGLVQAGKSHDIQADLHDACNHFRIALKLNAKLEKDPEVQLVFCCCLANTGQTEEAKNRVKEALKIVPEGDLKVELLELQSKIH